MQLHFFYSFEYARNCLGIATDMTGFRFLKEIFYWTRFWNDLIWTNVKGLFAWKEYDNSLRIHYKPLHSCSSWQNCLILGKILRWKTSSYLCKGKNQTLITSFYYYVKTAIKTKKISITNLSIINPIHVNVTFLFYTHWKAQETSVFRG